MIHTGPHLFNEPLSVFCLREAETFPVMSFSCRPAGGAQKAPGVRATAASSDNSQCICVERWLNSSVSTVGETMMHQRSQRCCLHSTRASSQRDPEGVANAQTRPRQLLLILLFWSVMEVSGPVRDRSGPDQQGRSLSEWNL